jgi:hypothetical protein
VNPDVDEGDKTYLFKVPTVTALKPVITQSFIVTVIGDEAQTVESKFKHYQTVIV